MICRDIERIEVVVFGFNFGPVHHGKSHCLKNPLDLNAYLRQRMQVAAWRAFTRLRKVKPVRLARGFHEFSCTPKRLGELALEGIERRAGSRAFISSQCAERFGKLGKRTLPAEILHAPRFETRNVIGSIKRRSRFGCELS